MSEYETNNLRPMPEGRIGTGEGQSISGPAYPAAGPNEITLLLQSPSPRSIDALLALVYDQLRSAAQLQIRSERNVGAGHTLSATALVHEAYLKLVGPREVPWQNRGHFYAAAAEAMRRILVDRARAKYGRAEATPRARQVALSLSGMEGLAADEHSDEGLLALDESLARFEKIDPQASAVVRLRFFTGLDLASTALALGISERTVKRDWAFARAWLQSDLGKAE
ncbi:MAG: RNA polymerase subunit sigma [Planctomycetes bacterium]|nr:RNA polymerase subunit sigma [Planctomycetota bacterium]